MSSLILRLLPYAAVAIALVGGFLWYGSSRYEAGEAAAEARAQIERDKANAEVRAKDAKYRASTADLQAQLVDALNRPAEIRTVTEPRTLVKEVTREGPTCPDFADDYWLRWNTIVTGDAGAPAPADMPTAPRAESLPTPTLVQRREF